MAVNLEMLRAFAERHEMEYSNDVDGVLDMLYAFYREENNYDNQQIKDGFRELCHQLNSLTDEKLDDIIATVCGLCVEHERMAFVEGVRIGVRICAELE